MDKPIAPQPTESLALGRVRCDTDPFDDEYHFISEGYLTLERTERETTFIEKALCLQPQSRIIELGCGRGRISLALARRGYSVTGVDINHNAVDFAKRQANAEALPARFIAQDLRTALSGSFDAAVSWYTSFGLMSDEEDQALLTNVAAVLRPSGRLLIDHLNRDVVTRALQATRVEEREGHYMIDFVSYDPVQSRLFRERRFLNTLGSRTTTSAIRLLSCTELADWLGRSGFATPLFTDSSGEPFRTDSSRMVLVAERH